MPRRRPPPPDPKDDGDLRYVPLEDDSAPPHPHEVTDDGAGSAPLPDSVAVSGPIKAGRGRTPDSEKWWVSAWMALIDGESMEGAVGRRLARKGAALSVEIASGHVQARIAATKTQIVRAAFSTETFDQETWAAVLTPLAGSLDMIAALLAGDLPRRAENALNALGLSFIPPTPRYECSCAEGWAAPCAHAAALHYVVGDLLAADPLLLFQLRGLPRTQIAPLLLSIHP